MSAQDIHPGTYLPQDQLFVWALIDPANPALVGAWPAHFAQHGICAADMEQLSASIDRDALKAQRKAFCY